MSMSKSNPSSHPAPEVYESKKQDMAIVHNQKVKTHSSDGIGLGKKLIVAGFGIAILGILFYCLPMVLLDSGQQEAVLSRGGLLIIGAGVLCWLIGAIRYLNASIDSNTPDDLF